VTASPQIGFGVVRHTRTRPAPHQFAYGNYFVWLPMRQGAQDPAAFDEAIPRNRWAPLSFYDSDHGVGGADSLAWLDALLIEQGITDCTGEVWLHTYPRVLGYVFKPVSFWYCYTAAHELKAVVVEVNNTFGERHIYVLDHVTLGVQQRTEKVFHVSPFCEVRGSYRFNFMHQKQTGQGVPNRVVARIDYTDTHWADGPLLCTSVSGTLEPLNARSRRRALWAYPLMTFGVMARIHWQALLLFLKRVPFFRKPAPPTEFIT